MRGVQTLLGHSDLRMTERFTRLAERVLVEAVQVLPRHPRNGNGDGESEALSLGEKNLVAEHPV